MSPIEVASGDVLVFTWEGEEPDGAAVLAALGAKGDASKIDIFRAAKIAPVGLETFLEEGHGVAADDLAPWKVRLDALSGVIIVLPASALDDGREPVEARPPLVHVATFREARAKVVTATPLASEAARGSLGGSSAKSTKSDARISGMVAFVVLLFLAIFVTVFVLSAG